jgi:hypothetical protein
VYYTNGTLWDGNCIIEGPPTTICACGTPASCVNWQWNMSCNCNISARYDCPYYNITVDNTLGTWGVQTNITARFNLTNFITGQIINLSGLGFLNVT